MRCDVAAGTYWTDGLTVERRRTLTDAWEATTEWTEGVQTATLLPRAPEYQHRVSYQRGWSATALPHPLRRAMMLATGTFYAYRELDHPEETGKPLLLRPVLAMLAKYMDRRA